MGAPIRGVELKNALRCPLHALVRRRHPLVLRSRSASGPVVTTAKPNVEMSKTPNQAGAVAGGRSTDR
jgi:hypothetical protein